MHKQSMQRHFSLINHFRIVILCLITLLLSGIPGLRAEPVSLRPEFDAAGLNALTLDGVDLLSNGTVSVTRVVTADRAGNRTNARFEPTNADLRERADDRTFTDASVEIRNRAFDADRRTLTLSYDWGRITVKYIPAPNALDFEVNVHNDSDSVIEFIKLQLAELTFSQDVKAEHVSATVSGSGISGCNLGGPELRRVVSDGGQVLWLSLQPNRPMRQRFEAAGERKLALTAAAGGETGGREVYDGVWDSRPIAPGAHDTYHLSLRVGTADVNPYLLAADVFREFGKAAPSTFKWSDRRPIGALHIADARRDGRNPRGWFFATHDKSVDVKKWDEYKEHVRKYMLQSVERIIECSRRQGLQGVIVWQIEGMQEPGHAYYGEPRILPYVAPEMDAVADEYFRRLREAGLRIGFCLRPPIQVPFELKPDGRPVVSWTEMREAAIRADWSVQFRNYDWMPEIPQELRDIYEPEEAWSVLARLDNKIAYAKKRWGATLFYLDTNYFSRPRDGKLEDWGLVKHHGLVGEWGDRRMIQPELLRELQRRHPDVLVITEWQSLQYWGVTAQYTGPPTHWKSGLDVRLAYPEGMTALAGPQVKRLLERPEATVKALLNGDTCLVDPVNCNTVDMVRQLFGDAARQAPFQVLVSDEGITVNGASQPDAGAFKTWLAQKLRDTPPLPERRVFIRYAEPMNATRLQNVIDAVTQAGGIVAWTQPADAK